MERDPFKLFIDLITFDQEIIKSKKEIEILKKNLSDSEAEVTTLDTNFQVIKNLLSDAKKEVDNIELQMKELDQKEKEKKDKLNTISNQKEYLSLKKEIERIQQTQHELEPSLVSAWNKLELSKNDYETKSKEIIKKIEDAQIKAKESRESLANFEDKIKELYKERPQKELNLPEEWLQKYNVMHSQVTNPVVSVVSNSCSACFYNMTNQDMINLGKKQLVQCKGCFRLLYLEN